MASEQASLLSLLGFCAYGVLEYFEKLQEQCVNVHFYIVLAAV